jgi:predicted  nucleic acid-binding Zn-ribbon protein
MSEISELEARVLAALDRIAAGADRLARSAPVPASDPAELAALQAALEDERIANAQLTERVKAIRDRQEQTVAALEGRVKALQQRAERAERQAAQVAQMNDRLRETAAALRKAVAEGAPEISAALDAALLAELEATREAQAADRAELEAIVAELQPMVAAARPAAQAATQEGKTHG